VPQVKLSASKEELELRNDNKKKKMTSSKVNSKTQNNNKLCLSKKQKNYVNKINSKIICTKIYTKTQAWATNPIASQKLFLQD
jgi:hypothetical protein